MSANVGLGNVAVSAVSLSPRTGSSSGMSYSDRRMGSGVSLFTASLGGMGSVAISVSSVGIVVTVSVWVVLGMWCTLGCHASVVASSVGSVTVNSAAVG